jgi:hypothetical protein
LTSGVVRRGRRDGRLREGSGVEDNFGRGGFGVSGSKYSIGFSILSIYFVLKKAFYNNYK